MANWAKIGKWAAVLTPVAIAGVWYYNKTQKDKAANFGETQKAPTKPTLVTPSNTNTFPLKKGVKNNDYVKALQSALGVIVDGWFGKDTLAALQQQANKSEIADLADLTNTIDVIKDYNQSDSVINKQVDSRDKILSLLYDYEGENKKYPYNHWRVKKGGALSTKVEDVNGEYADTDIIKNYKGGEVFDATSTYLTMGTDSTVRANAGYLFIYHPSDGSLWKIAPEQVEVIA